MFLRDAPISQRLMAIILLICGAVSLLTCASFSAFEFFTFRQNTIANLTTIGSVLASNSTAALTFDNPEDATEILAALQAEPHIRAAGLYDEAGKLLAHYPSDLPTGALPATPEVDGNRLTAEFLISVQPVVHDSTRVGTLYLKSDMDAMYERFALYGSIVAAIVIASFLLAYGLSRRFQRQISQPIFDLANIASAVAQRGDYSVRAPKTGKGEFIVLTEAFNQMLDRIHDGDRGRYR